MHSVALVALTKPVVEGVDTAEQFLAYCARVSNPANQNNHDTGPKLVRTLLTSKHWSPLEMVNLVIEVKTTRDIARQILRHRTFTFQEFSQRYAVATNFHLREARLQDNKNRQNSIVTDDDELQQLWLEYQRNVLDITEEAYSWALENGVAKEQARAILPEGLTESTLYMNGTLRSWVHYCQLRMAWDTQLEHRKVAEDCWNIIGTHFPNVVEACRV